MHLASRVRLVVKDVLRRRILTLGYPSKRFRYGERTGDEATVLICLWNRPSRIDPILRMLDDQDHAGGIRLFLWNNAKKDHDRYLDGLKAFTRTGALTEASIVRSPMNVGSIGRFYWARWLTRRQGSFPIIVIDDDQDVPPGFVSSAIGIARPRTISAWWAFVVSGGYWDRRLAQAGEEVNHIGPGGMVADSALFADADFFRAVPGRFWMLDDVWVSAFALNRGYTLRKLDADIEFVMSDTNQYHSQLYAKEEFFDLLTPMRVPGSPLG